MPEARIKARVDTDASSVGRELGKASSQASAFASRIRGIGRGLAGAFSIGAGVNLAKNLIGSADDISDTAEAFGLTTDELQAFNAVAREGKGGIEGLESSLKKLNESQADAVNGSEAQQKSFKRLGIEGDDLTVSTAELVKKIADGYVATGDLAAVQDLLGRSAVSTTGFLKQLSSQGVGDLIASMNEAGQVIEAQVIQKLATVNDRLATMGNRVKTAAASTIEFGDLVGGTIGAMIEGRGLKEAVKFTRDIEKEKSDIAKQEGEKRTAARREELRELAEASKESQAKKIEELVIKGSARSESIGNQLVRIGARGGIAGVESESTRQLKAQLAELRKITANTSNLEDLETGTFQ